MRLQTILTKIKALVLTAGLFFCTILPAQAEKPYFLAVYASRDFNTTAWLPYSPDLLFESNGWTDFPKFLDMVVKGSKGKYIILELQVHGLDYLAVKRVLPNWCEINDQASFGYVVNQIEKKLPTNKLLVICEACYSGYVYKHTIRNNTIRIPNALIEDHPGPVPFPILGIGSKTEGITNLVFRQYYHNIPTYIMDLRFYENNPCEVRDLNPNSPANKRVEKLWMFLWDNQPPPARD